MIEHNDDDDDEDNNVMMTMWEHECARSVAFGAKRAIELEMNQTDLKY